MPVFECHIGSLQVNEDIARPRVGYRSGVAVRQRVGWRRLIDAVVYKMSAQSACLFGEQMGRATNPFTAGMV